MTIALWCVLAAGLMPLLWTGIAVKSCECWKFVDGMRRVFRLRFAA